MFDRVKITAPLVKWHLIDEEIIDKRDGFSDQNLLAYLSLKIEKAAAEVCLEEWIDGWIMAPINSVQKDDLTSSLFHFDHFKESLEADAGESYDKHYCSKTAAIAHLQIPSPVTQVQKKPTTKKQCEPWPCVKTRPESNCKLTGNCQETSGFQSSGRVGNLHLQGCVLFALCWYSNLLNCLCMKGDTECLHFSSYSHRVTLKYSYFDLKAEK